MRSSHAIFSLRNLVDYEHRLLDTHNQQKESPMFLKSLIPSSNSCAGGVNCPNILELDSGNFAIIGLNITSPSSKAALPQGSGCGDDEAIVEVPRSLLISAKLNIPDKI